MKRNKFKVPPKNHLHQAKILKSIFKARLIIITKINEEALKAKNTTIILNNFYPIQSHL